MSDWSDRTEDEIRASVVDQIREVQIPGGDPISEELIENIAVSDGRVTLTVVFDRLDMALADRVTAQLRGAGLATAGVDSVRIEAANAGAPESGVPITGADTVLTVASAKGGVGKSTITAALARALEQAGRDVAVFDANVHSPDVAGLLGAEGPVRQTPSGRPDPIDVDGIEVLSVELIADDGPVAWRGAMVHEVVKDLLGDAAWTDRDVLLVDLPPGIGDAVYTIVQQAPLDGTLLVSTPTDESARATERTSALFEANDVPIVGVVPNMVGDDGPYPEHGDGSDLAEAISEDVYETIDPVPFDPALREPLERDFETLETDGEAGIASLREVVASFVEKHGDPDVPSNAIDVRGLPPTTGHRETLAELEPSADESVAVVTHNEPDELVEAVETGLEREEHGVRATTSDLGRKGWLVELETERAA
ncbi:P-loop NTPase [Halobiforma nitratireducens]|uniref:ParA/MinD ATPase-like protein n=1 Tax=Halobiforma nitratireducens JCM 10879 TaxID=1227454 RepID=M0MNF7_9EURY|nr:P-loop NTPase [Halobiforma nitratireducens]EMA46903.1 ParA/MinD ATPase-like protein [Halobiforma nitratireducens JCM 10879]